MLAANIPNSVSFHMPSLDELMLASFFLRSNNFKPILDIQINSSWVDSGRRLVPITGWLSFLWPLDPWSVSQAPLNTTILLTTNGTRPTDTVPRLSPVPSASRDGTPISASLLMGNQATRSSQHPQSPPLTVFSVRAVQLVRFS